MAKNDLKFLVSFDSTRKVETLRHLQNAYPVQMKFMESSMTSLEFTAFCKDVAVFSNINPEILST